MCLINNRSVILLNCQLSWNRSSAELLGCVLHNNMNEQDITSGRPIIAWRKTNDPGD